MDTSFGIWNVRRFVGFRSLKRVLAKYKLCFGRVEEVRQNMLDTELVGRMEVSTGQNV
jgi:hypothetical protein